MTAILDAAIRAGVCAAAAEDDADTANEVGIAAALRAMFDAVERDPTVIEVLDLAFCKAMAANNEHSIDRGWEAAIRALKAHVLGE
jgi:hypothetical protein